MKLFESDVNATDTKLHIYRTNTDKLPLVFAHGMSDNGLCFWPFAEQLASDYEIILYDSRNHGQSDAAAEMTLIDRAHDLAGLVEALELQKPGLVGHSLGAVTVALFAGLYPDMPGCIVLEDPPPFRELASDDDSAKLGMAMWRASAAENKEKTVEELVEMNREECPTWPEAERIPWAQSKQQFNLNAFDEERIDAISGNEIVSQITCPALIITADLDRHSIYPPQTADELVARLPNFTHVNIPGAGHNIRREQPQAYLTAVREFLSTCTANQ
jgi:N-formylmaleamate deformylase